MPIDVNSCGSTRIATENPSFPSVVLTAAGFEPRSASGLLRDVEVFRLLGVHPVGVSTCLTLQTGGGVELVQPLDAALIEKQILLLASEFPLRVAKVGLLPEAGVIEVLAAQTKRLRLEVVLDPILTASSGESLLDRYAVKALQEKLFPLALLVTPNRMELERFLGESPNSRDDLRSAARDFCQRFQVPGVLLKGFHEKERVLDGLFYEGSFSLFSHPYRHGHPRGTGCLLSSAIAAYLAQGVSLPTAVKQAEAFLERTIASSFRVSSGDFIANLSESQ